MNKVQEAIEIAQKLVSTPQGVFAYLKGATWSRFNYWISHMAMVQMTDEEKIREIAKDFLGVKLTPAQCATVKGILGLQEVVTSFNDIANVESFLSSWEAGTLKGVDIENFTMAAKKRIAIDIMHSYETATKTGSREEKISKLVKYWGISYAEARQEYLDANKWPNFAALVGLYEI